MRIFSCVQGSGLGQLYHYGRSDLAATVWGRTLSCRDKSHGNISSQNCLLLFDRVGWRNAAEIDTKRGLIASRRKQTNKILQATDQELKKQDGDIQPVSVKVGDQVFLSEYWGTKVVLDDKDYFIFSHTSYFKNRRLGSSSVGHVCLAFMEPWGQSSALHRPCVW